MLNTFSVVGEVTDEPMQLPNGSYTKIRLRLDNPLANRSEYLEVVGKSDRISDQIRPGSIVAVTGQVGGKINDKGYLNMSLWVNNVSLIQSAYRQAQPRQEHPNYPPPSYEPIKPRPRPAEPVQYDENDDDIPF